MTLSDRRPRRPSGRYDEARALPRPLARALAGLLALGLLAGAYLAYQRSTAQRVPFTLLGYQVVDERSVAVEFEVYRGEQQQVSCLVQALDRDKAEVGSEHVQVTPEDSDTVRITVLTTRRASSARVLSCQPADGAR